MNKIAFYWGAFDPPQIAHLTVARQVIRDEHADRVHISPSGTRPDKSYNVANHHRRKMLLILLEEYPQWNTGIFANFDFIDAPREQSATRGVHNWFTNRYWIVPKQIFGTDIIPNIDKCWMYPDWVKQKASKLFVPRGTEDTDYTGIANYKVMPLDADDFILHLSSSQIRERVPEGDFRGLTNGVADYIHQHELYLPTKNTTTISLFISQKTHEIITHNKARHEKHQLYPTRFVVPDDMVDWRKPFPNYIPIEYTAPEILHQFAEKGSQGWADSAEKSEKIETIFRSYEWRIAGDNSGRPLNPKGRTGITGRWILGKWGANFAADPMVTRNNPETGWLELLVIQREENHEWAIPGGMVDFGEYGSQTAKRELKEEAWIEVDFSLAPIIYQWCVDDPRNTDNAWIETTAVHVHLSDEQWRKAQPQAGDDAENVRWISLVNNEQEINSLYANHGAMVRTMLQKIYNPENMSAPKIQIITAPEVIPESPLPKVFLAGSIEQDTAADWQKEFIQQLQQTPCMILNPRRTSWDPTWNQDDNPQLTEQIRWELDGIESADMVCFYFDPSTRSPITLLEMGLARNKKNVHICCPLGFWRRANVLETARTLGYIVHETPEELIRTIEKLWTAG